MARMSGSRGTARGLVAAASLGLLLPTAVAHAEELPPFRQGMWEFTRTVEAGDASGKPVVLTNSTCTNPTERMKQQHEQTAKLGCKASPLSKKGNAYSFTADCTIQGTPVHSSTVITVESNSAYSLRVETSSGSKQTVETLKARRTGDCTKQ